MPVGMVSTAVVAGVAQMDVRVDQPGQDVQAGGVDGFVGGRVGGHAEGGDAAVAHADVGLLRCPRAGRRCRCGSAGRNARACLAPSFEGEMLALWARRSNLRESAHVACGRLLRRARKRQKTPLAVERGGRGA